MSSKGYTVLGWVVWQIASRVAKRKIAENRVKIGAAGVVALVLIGGGAADEDELAAPIERGLYVTRLWYLNPVHEQSTLMTGTTRDGTFLIEDGEITRPAKDVRFTDSILRILAATEALSGTQRLVGDLEFYGRRFATGTVAPALRAQGLRVTGGA